ncbi:MAG: squalene synthase HpnC [Chloroflexi bacterium RBG_16_64_32]|nr:MAG: squalene synthase HpnC [Chloroflexi bacterium RBG_16_64_32]
MAEGYAYCQRLATSHYENFSVASWLLPRPLRPHMYAVYAYCRGVDDLGDEAEGDRLALLDGWEAELRRCYEGSPQQPAFVALQETIRRFDIPTEPFRRLIEANRADQRVSRYRSYNDLLGYCENSANPVGRLVLYIYGYRDEERQRLSDATCTALQLTNFWQDVRRDLDKGRIYIPLEDMERFDYGEADLLAGRSDGRFRDLMAFQVQRTRELFRDGLALMPKVSGRLTLDLRLFSLGGLAVLDAIEGMGYDVLQRRPTLSRARKAWLVVRGLLPIRVRVEKAP